MFCYLGENFEIQFWQYFKGILNRDLTNFEIISSSFILRFLFFITGTLLQKKLIVKIDHRVYSIREQRLYQKLYQSGCQNMQQGHENHTSPRKKYWCLVGNEGMTHNNH